MREEIEAMHKKYPAPGWVEFAFKYFSKSSTDLRLSRGISWILGSFFLVGFFATVFKASRAVRGIATVAFTLILAPLVLFLVAAVINNNRRIRKICKELGITLDEYEWWMS